MPTLYQILREHKPSAIHEREIESGQELMDNDCLRVSSVYHKAPDPAYDYIRLDIYEGVTMGAWAVANFEWIYNRYRDWPIAIMSVTSDCAFYMTHGVERRDVQDPARLMNMVSETPDIETSMHVPLDYEVDWRRGQQFVADYRTYMDAMLNAQVIDQGIYQRVIDGLVESLWEVEWDMPMEMLSPLVLKIVERMGIDPKSIDLDDEEGADLFVERALAQLPVRQMYEEAGGEYRIEPDDTLSELRASGEYTGQFGEEEPKGLEPRPVALFDYDDDVLETMIRDPRIRNIYATPPMAMNR